MPHVALDVELGLLAVRGRGKGHVPVNARVCTGSNPADHTTLACCVSPFKNYDDPRPRSLNPPLQMSKLDLELRQLLLKFLAAHFRGRGPFISDAVLLLLVFCHVATLLTAARWQRHYNLTNRSETRTDYFFRSWCSESAFKWLVSSL